MATNKPIVILVSFPLTPITSFVYFLANRAGIFHNEVYVRYHTYVAYDKAPTELGKGTIINFSVSQKQLVVYCDRLIAQTSFPLLDIHKKLLASMVTEDSLSRKIQQSILSKSISLPPKTILDQIAKIFDEIVPEEDTERVSEQILNQEILLPTEPVTFPEAECSGYLPEFKRMGDINFSPNSYEISEGEFVTSISGELLILSGQYEYSFLERRCLELQEQQIVIAIGGTKVSHKRKMQASLAFRMQQILASLQSRPEWRKLSLKIESKAQGQQTQSFEEENKLAREMLDTILKASENSNILFIDLPDKIDSASEIIACRADAAILLVDDLNEVKPWQFFFSRLGIPIIAKIKAEENSLITKYEEGKYIEGNIEPNHLIEIGNLTLNFLSLSLLYDLLPSLYGGRIKKIKLLLEEKEL